MADSISSKKKQQQRQQKADAKRSGKRTRNWTFIVYPEDVPQDWRELLDEARFRWVEGPVHDKDVNADGLPKKTHVHCLAMFDAIKRQEQVVDILQSVFGASESGSIIGVATPQQVADRGALVRYMAHLDNPEKAQYDVADIVGHNGADPAELLHYSATEMRLMIVAMEEYIDEHNITELADFAAAIRYDNPEWHTILATKMTIYFNAYLRSRQRKVAAQAEWRSVQTQQQENKSKRVFQVDPETGELITEKEPS